MTVDFSMIQEDTRIIRYQVFDGNTPVDLTTAASVTWGFVRQGVTNSSAIVIKTIGNGIVIENTNEAVVTISPSDTSGLLGKFEHTLTVEDFSNDFFSENGLFIINNKAND